MDDRRFDDLAKTIARVRSRRDMVKRIGGLAAAAIGLSWWRDAEAVVCRTDGQVCRENINCCSLFCNPPSGLGHQRLCGPAPTTTSTTTTAVPCLAIGADCAPTGGLACCNGFICSFTDLGTTGFQCVST